MTRYNPQHVPTAQEIAHAEFNLEQMNQTYAMNVAQQTPGIVAGQSQIGNVLGPLYNQARLISRG